ncbi:hypothetical protein N0V88_008069 [Collariella sp. IMI 366227]|nr:hypothetical protein N0V88_008069 [Collariella sp. IMI 366227]
MRLLSHALWSIATLLPGLHVAIAVDAAAGVLQADLVFPQDGEVYAPTPDMPFVFALQTNASLARYTDPTVYVRLKNLSDSDYYIEEFEYEYKDHDWTRNELYFPYYIFDQFAAEGEFTIKQGGKAIDLTKALAENNNDNKPCIGTVITVGDEAYKAKWLLKERLAGECVVANYTTHSTCPAAIDPAVVANISADLAQRACGRPDAPAGCPPSNGAAQQLAMAVIGPALLAAAVGALGLLEVLA